MIRTILLATDLSPFSTLSLQCAINLCGNLNARLLVVHAVESPGSYAETLYASCFSDCNGEKRRDLFAKLQRHIVAAIEEECRDIMASEQSVELEVVVREGRSTDVVLSLASERNAGMIVVGSHGANSPGRHVLGSVTTRVMQLAKIPVCMVPMISPDSWRHAAEIGSRPYCR